MNPNQHQNEPHQLARRTLGLVLAGGRGSRLHALTDRRAKPAVYFGGKFRIVDFALSNGTCSAAGRSCAASSTSTSICCPRSNASTRPRGTRGRPTRSSRTSTS